MEMEGEKGLVYLKVPLCLRTVQSPANWKSAYTYIELCVCNSFPIPICSESWDRDDEEHVVYLTINYIS